MHPEETATTLVQELLADQLLGSSSLPQPVLQAVLAPFLADLAKPRHDLRVNLDRASVPTYIEEKWPQVAESFHVLIHVIVIVPSQSFVSLCGPLLLRSFGHSRFA